MVEEYNSLISYLDDDSSSAFFDQVNIALDSITEPPYTGIPCAFVSRYRNPGEEFERLLDLTSREATFYGGGNSFSKISGLDLFKKLFAFSYEQNLKRGFQVGDTIVSDLEQNEDGTVSEVKGFKPSLTIILNCLMWAAFPSGLERKSPLGRKDVEETFSYNFRSYSSPENPNKSFFTLMGGMSQEEASVVFNTAIAVNDVLMNRDDNVKMSPEKSKQADLDIPEDARFQIVFYNLDN